MAEDKFSNELMSDDELDNVAGGDSRDCQDDSRFLNSLNGSCDRYGLTRIAWSFGVHSAEIERAWATVGIKADVSFYLTGSRNSYYLNGKEITQEEARQHAMKVTGHHMSEADWNW